MRYVMRVTLCAIIIITLMTLFPSLTQVSKRRLQTCIIYFYCSDVHKTQRKKRLTIFEHRNLYSDSKRNQ